MEWNDRLLQLFSEAVCRYHEQVAADAERFFTEPERLLLAEIGSAPCEMFDYVKEYATQGDPTPSTVLLIASVRRAYFITSQRRMSGGPARLKDADIPQEEEALQDMAYLPRIIRKAEAKLFGTMPEGLMFYCANDRKFLRTHGDIPPADFLNVVWGARGDRQKVVSYVLRAMREKEEAGGISGEVAALS